MRTAWSLGLTAAIVSQTVFAIGAKAASFPDVSSGNPYSVAISALADMKVINGNPDGTFAPGRTVNRAEFLILLYRAKAMTPHTPTSACFKDVPMDAWFSAVVCDAAGKGLVGGYSDKTFKPEQAVNRVEALKMMFTVLGLSQQTTLSATTQALGYSDVSASAWYMVYVSAAFKLHVLPVPGVHATMLQPDGGLTRAEAAAYIYNAISSQPLPLDGSMPTSSSMMMQESSSAMMQQSSAMMRSSAASMTELETGKLTQVDLPFNDNGVFVKKLTNSYRFSLKQTSTVTFLTTVSGNNTPDDVTCRLFKIESGDSFSLEYYLGFQDKDSCTILATLSSGSYQMDIQPRISALPYTVVTKTVKGDGNDGFSQAKSLIFNAPSSAFIDGNDLADFYTFKIGAQTNMMVELTNADNLKCVIYPMGDVDIYGFAEPNCNAQYDFPQGTYYVGVMQKNEHSAKQSYSVRTKK